MAHRSSLIARALDIYAVPHPPHWHIDHPGGHVHSRLLCSVRHLRATLGVIGDHANRLSECVQDNFAARLSEIAARLPGSFAQALGLIAALKQAGSRIACANSRYSIELAVCGDEACYFRRRRIMR